MTIKAFWQNGTSGLKMCANGMQINTVVYTGGELGGYAAQFYPARDNFPKNTETSYLIDREWFNNVNA